MTMVAKLNVPALVFALAYSATAFAQQSAPVLPGKSMAADLAPRIDIFEGAIETPDEMTTGAIIRENELLGYCFNVADLAVEARSTFLREELQQIESDVDRKLDLLDQKIAELKLWYEKRDAFLASANDSLVKIFQTMRPDAAAQQMSMLNPALSAALVAKLEPRVASVILNEMKADDAAKITSMLASSMEAPDDDS